MVQLGLDRSQMDQSIGVVFILAEHLLIFLFRFIEPSVLQSALRVKNEWSRAGWEFGLLASRFDGGGLDLLVRLLEQCLLFRRVRGRLCFEPFQAGPPVLSLPL